MQQTIFELRVLVVTFGLDPGPLYERARDMDWEVER